MMDSLPTDVLTHVAIHLLCDQDRLALATCCRRTHAVACLDVPVYVYVPDTILDVRGQTGFDCSPHGYWHVFKSESESETTTKHSTAAVCPCDLASMAATQPWTFVRTWMSMPHSVKTLAFRKACVQALALQSVEWHADALASLKILLSHSDVTPSNVLVKRAVWNANLDALQFLLDRGVMKVDDENGALLRLALSTLERGHVEDKVVKVAKYLLLNGADPSRHDCWAIRMCVFLGFHDLARILCFHSGPQVEDFF